METFVIHHREKTFLLRYRESEYRLQGPVKRMGSPNEKFEDSIIETIHEGTASTSKEAQEKAEKFLASLDA